MTDTEEKLLAEVAWKENRHGQILGMQSVMNVVLNRAKKPGNTIKRVILAPKQFTSMSVESDPEYGLDPTQAKGEDAVAWQEALALAGQAAAGTLNDLTSGATLYFDPKGIVTHRTITLPTGETIPFPQTWNEAAVKYTATIQNQVFFREV